MSLNKRLSEILESTNLTNPHEIAKEILKGMDNFDREAALKQILPAWVSTNMSTGPKAPLPAPEAAETPSEAPSVPVKQQAIKQAGKSWHKHTYSWDKKRLSTGIPGVWVLWPEFSVDMCVAKVEMLGKRIATMKTTAGKYETIRATLEKHGVAKVGDLPESAKSALEKELGDLPED